MPLDATLIRGPCCRLVCGGRPTADRRPVVCRLERTRGPCKLIAASFLGSNRPGQPTLGKWHDQWHVGFCLP